jgi:hypothetical protein
MRFNTDKRVMFDIMLGNRKEDIGSTPAFPLLFEKYFKGRVNEEFTIGDLKDLSEDIESTTKLETFSKKVKKGQYFDVKTKAKESSIFRLLSKEATTVIQGSNSGAIIPVSNECIIGSSSVENAVWFHFTNEMTDVISGTIYIRTSPIKKLSRFSTFEVNPFIASKALNGDVVLDKYEEKKPQVTFNPNWFLHTLRDIERQVFSKLIV